MDLLSLIQSTDLQKVQPPGPAPELLSWSLALDVGVRLGVAAVLGALLALHPLRLRRQWAEGMDWDTVRAQILIAVAGSLMVVVIGDSIARAFGLVGIGSFIRFRTAMKNPRDTAILFLLIGLGMACGLKFYALAALSAVFLFLLLFPLELGRSQKKKPKHPEEPDLPSAGEDLL